MSGSKLTEEELAFLKELSDEIVDISRELVMDYKNNPSDLSGSLIQIHQNSPFLKEDWLIFN